MAEISFRSLLVGQFFPALRNVEFAAGVPIVAEMEAPYPLATSSSRSSKGNDSDPLAGPNCSAGLADDAATDDFVRQPVTYARLCSSLRFHVTVPIRPLLDGFVRDCSFPKLDGSNGRQEVSVPSGLGHCAITWLRPRPICMCHPVLRCDEYFATDVLHIPRIPVERSKWNEVLRIEARNFGHI